MSFYNKGAGNLATPVGRFVDPNGTHPLIVLAGGGTQRVTATVNSGVNTTLLPIPGAGGTWRLHRWTYRATGTPTAGGDVFLEDPAASFVFDDCGTSQNLQRPGGDLGGLLTQTAVSFLNNMSLAVVVYLTYDSINGPIYTLS